MESIQTSEQTVLIVDDNLNNLNVLFDALSDFGFEMLVAKSGTEALKRIELVCLMFSCPKWTVFRSANDSSKMRRQRISR